MTMSMLYPFNLPPMSELNMAQMNGDECIYCWNGVKDSMRPVGRLMGGLLWGHADCAEENRIEEERHA
ncbi:hypothetical protein [Streptomyces sp. NPDC058280]|uniref:hypothetical protein n=1 Tax=Streptomyces sp. NPDC058280 TaxID=3346419 RepID=UPI0036EA9B02